MRSISAGLAAAQAVRAPRAEVTMTAAPRGQNPRLPMLDWTEVVGNVGQAFHFATTAVGLADGALLRFRNTGSLVVVDRVTNPHLAASWASPTTWTVRAHSSAALAALRKPGTSTIYLFYLQSNNVYLTISTNNGSTWSSPDTVYSGGAAAGDLVAAYDTTRTDGPWFVGFSTYDGGTGEYTARFGHGDAGSWSTAAYAVGWRAAGVIADAPAGSRHVVAVYRQEGMGPSRIRLLDKQGGSYANPVDIDQTQGGLLGLHLPWARYCQLPESGVTVGLVAESAYGAGAYAGVAGVFYVGGHALADEGIILDRLSVMTNKGDYFALAETTNGDVYVVGDTAVWRGARMAAPTALPTPSKYVYDEGMAEIELPASPAVAQLKVGMVVTVTRTLRWGMQSGSEAWRGVVVRVERRTDGCSVLAYDALAFLGTVRCRRPMIANDGSAAGAATVMRRLAARHGIAVAVDNAALETAAVMPFTVMPSESLRGGAYRVGSQSEWYLLPATDGFGLKMVTPGVSASGQHDDTPVALGAAEGVVWQAAEVRDYRRLAFSYVFGAYSTDPEDGGAVGMATGRPEPGTRPLSYSLTNMRYNSDSRVAAAAQAEALRQADLSPGAWCSINAHLGLEVMDVVEVTEPGLGWAARPWRVRRLREDWDKGRLTQRLWLGETG